MRTKFAKSFISLLIIVLLIGIVITAFVTFFDQATLVRKGTIYHVAVPQKVVALTFDDGPSLEWTPLILDQLKKLNIKATFFMIGEHVAKYPDIARRLVEEGHDIGNHTYTHHGLINYKMEQLVQQIQDTEKIIKQATGKTTQYFRPPKAWLTNAEKAAIKSMGYKIVLWTLNSKDWVNFHDKYTTKYLLHHIKPGDIILFHDGGGAFKTEGGDRSETLKTIALLARKLSERGYRFVTITELLNMQENVDKK